jgi:hypothetical protein
VTNATEVLSKDQLVAAMLAAMGGERREVNERDLFLACWHAFPNAMRWADSALPNPDTFTASLRRLDADGVIVRVGKQARAKSRKSTRRAALEVGRSGVVKARVKEGGLEKAGISREDVEAVRTLAPAPESYRRVSPWLLVLLCIAAREAEGRATDEGALVETAFHKFPAVFAYPPRPEFPDVERIRSAVADARSAGLINERLELTEAGKSKVEEHGASLSVRVDPSESYKTGAFRFAQGIESSPAYQQYSESGSLAATKGDELFRALRLPPTTDTRRIATALQARARELRRIDRGDLVEYLLRVADKHNPEVIPLLEEELAMTDGSRTGRQEGMP